MSKPRSSLDFVEIENLTTREHLPEWWWPHVRGAQTVELHARTFATWRPPFLLRGFMLVSRDRTGRCRAFGHLTDRPTARRLLNEIERHLVRLWDLEHPEPHVPEPPDAEELGEIAERQWYERLAREETPL